MNQNSNNHNSKSLPFKNEDYLVINLEDLKSSDQMKMPVADPYYKYRQSIKQKKWPILGIAVFINILLIGSFYFFSQPTYKTTAIIEFSGQYIGESAGKSKIVKMDYFLEEVVDTLSATLPGFENKKSAVKMLSDKLSSELDMSRKLLNIHYTDNDPNQLAYITNKIADLFVQKVYNVDNQGGANLLDSLRNSRNIAKKEFEEAEKALEQFRAGNPNLSLIHI